MAKFLPVIQVTKDNVYDLIVVSGFQPYDDVYRDIPDSGSTCQTLIRKSSRSYSRPPHTRRPGMSYN